jgi:tellurite resistance protein TehA-like permease
VLGGALWLGVMYGFLTAVTIRDPKPSLAQGLNGSWLLLVVATQSVSNLASLLVARGSLPAEGVLFVSLCLYLVGCLLYVLVITLIFYRFTFVGFDAAGLTPPYWINMGAVAITVLAGTAWMQPGSASLALAGFVPFVRGLTLFFWAVATWWIPLLFVLGAWRHLRRRYPLRYDTQYWGMVFPLGMYTAGTLQLAGVLHIGFLAVIPRGFVWLALAAWLATFAGMAATLVRRLARGSGAP